MFYTRYRMLGAGAWGRSREMIWRGRWEGGSGLGTHVHPWLIHVNVWQNQYSTVKQNKVKLKILKKEKKSYEQPRQHVKKQRHYFANKGPSSQGYGFSSSHVWMWELDYKATWVLKNWCFLTVVLGKTLESPLDSKEIQPVHHKVNQTWIFIGRTDAEAQTLILWPPDAKDSFEKTLGC